MTLSGNVKCHQKIEAIENPPALSRPLLPTVMAKHTQNEVPNGSFPVNALIRFELITEEIEFMAHCCVDIVLI
jgi:hypothetical protein